MDMKWIVAAGMVAVLAIIAFLMYYAAKSGYKDKVFGLLYQMVCRAEMEFTGSGRGAEKKEWVIERIHDALPKWARILVSEQDIENLLELAVTKMKEYLLYKSQED